MFAGDVSARDRVASADTSRRDVDISSAVRAGRVCADRRGPDENLNERFWFERTSQWR